MRSQLESVRKEVSHKCDQEKEIPYGFYLSNAAKMISSVSSNIPDVVSCA